VARCRKKRVAVTWKKPSAKRNAANAGAKKLSPIDSTAKNKAQTNFTNPDAKIMNLSNKGSDYSHNDQAVLNGEEQIIEAAEVTSAANDKQQAVPIARTAPDNLDEAGIEEPKMASC
jgi:hypothetical protein